MIGVVLIGISVADDRKEVLEFFFWSCVLWTRLKFDWAQHPTAFVVFSPPRPSQVAHPSSPAPSHTSTSYIAHSVKKSAPSASLMPSAPGETPGISVQIPSSALWDSGFVLYGARRIGWESLDAVRRVL